MIRAPAIALLLSAGAAREKVEIRIKNDGEPGRLEILGTDGGRLWRGDVRDEVKASVPAADRWELRFLRVDAGVLTQTISQVKGIFWTEIAIGRYATLPVCTARNALVRNVR